MINFNNYRSAIILLVTKTNNKKLSSEYMKLYMDASANSDDIVTQAWGSAAFGIIRSLHV